MNVFYLSVLKINFNKWLILEIFRITPLLVQLDQEKRLLLLQCVNN